MSMDTGQPKRRRRSRNRVSDIPDLARVLHENSSANRTASAGIARDFGRGHGPAPLRLRNGTTGLQNHSMTTGVQDIISPSAQSLESSIHDAGMRESSYQAQPSPIHDSLNSLPAADSTAGINLDFLRETVMGEAPTADSPMNGSHNVSDVDDSVLGDYPDVFQPSHRTVSTTLRISNWRVLWGLLRTNGNHKFTKTSYQSVRNLLEVIARGNNSSWRDNFSSAENPTERPVSVLPHFTTLHKTYRPILMKELVPKCKEQLMSLDLSKAGARATQTSPEGVPKCRVRTILPREYARADIATPPVWDQMRSTALSAHQRAGRSFEQPTVSSQECVDVWPIISGREWFYGPQTALHLDTEGIDNSLSTFAEPGDVLGVTQLQSPSRSVERFQRCFGLDGSNAQYNTVRGTIVHTWTVHHASRRGQASFTHTSSVVLSARDSLICDTFNYVSYTSPSDAVTLVVPEIPPPTDDDVEDSRLQTGDRDSSGRVKKPRISPGRAEAIRIRRAAQKERKSQMASAWRNWEKPIIKPGDFVTMIRPCVDQDFPFGTAMSHNDATLLTTVDRTSRICLVSRFWVENEEQNMFLFWISGSTDLGPGAPHLPTEELRLRSLCSPVLQHTLTSTIMDVLSVQLTACHRGSRGPARYSPMSSEGILANGENYFVYRFVLYWDGFEVQTGKSATGEGFYLICLNLPLAARSSPNAVRVLSLTPPGVKADEGLHAITSDIVEGMTIGFEDYDAEGVKRRIFLDLVAFLSDTPALNSFLDVMGHTSTACCHLCRYRRGATTLVGSRYSVGRSHGMISHSMRSFFHHTAVRDCGALGETCKLLGMKPQVSSSTAVMFSLREAMFNVRASVPKTNTGNPVVSHFIDPYRACFVAPDHLLTGHFRDCVALALRLLPSDFYRISCERFMMGLLEDASLPIQNRLVDHKKKALYSMSMSELYALSAVADVAFSSACHYASKSQHCLPLSAKCQEALNLVQSCANLISELWFFPRLYRDGPICVQAFDHDNGTTNMSRLQCLTNTHLDDLARICHLQDEDVLLLEDRLCSKEQKSKISKEMREALIAIRTVDKPNLHRLRELVHTTLPLVGYIGRVGELVLEKTHQTLKRSIHLSNNREIQLHAMSGAASSDWQGRLAMVVSTAATGQETALRCCFRLLAGRDAIASLQGKLSPVVSSDVIRALGPGHCLANELLALGHRVLSSKAPTNTSVGCCSIDRPYQLVPVCDPKFPQHQHQTFRFLKGAYGGDLTRYTAHVGDDFSYTHSNSTRHVRFRRGDILQILTYQHMTPRSHFPFLLQPNCMDPVPSWTPTIGISLWFLHSVVSLEKSHGSTTYFAAVLPCLQTASLPNSEADNQRFSKYRVSMDGNLSFGKLEESVCLAGVLHDCYNCSCRPSTSRISLSHSEGAELALGGHFLALTTRRGYPPRQG